MPGPLWGAVAQGPHQDLVGSWTGLTSPRVVCVRVRVPVLQPPNVRSGLPLRQTRSVYFIKFADATQLGGTTAKMPDDRAGISREVDRPE